MAGDDCAMLPTIAGAAAGFKPTAALTTSMVVCLRFFASAVEIISAALEGSSAAVVALKEAKKGLAPLLSAATAFGMFARTAAARKDIRHFIVFIKKMEFVTPRPTA